MATKTADSTTVDMEEKLDAEAPNAGPDGVISHSDLLDALDHLKELPNVLQEGILFAGGGVAILLQAAIPGVMKGSQESSELASRYLDSIQAIISYVCCLTFGTREERKTLLDMINRDEAPLKGNDYYSEDPMLRLWVAASLYATATDLYQRIYGRVDYRTAERVYREYALLTTALRLPSGVWPKDRQEFWTYWDDTIEKIEGSSLAKGVEKDLVRSFKVLPRWVRMFKPFLRVLTSEMLPPQIRRDYGLKSTKARRGLYRFTIGFAVAVYPTFPKSIRSYPQRFYLEKLRQRLKSTV